METQTRLLLAASALALTLALPGHVMASNDLDDVDLTKEENSSKVVAVESDGQPKDNSSGGWSSWLPWNWGAKPDGQSGDEELNSSKSPDVNLKDEEKEQEAKELQLGEVDEDIKEGQKIEELQRQLKETEEELEKEKAASQELEKELEEQKEQLSALSEEKEEAEKAKQAAEEEIAEKEAQKALDEKKLEELEEDKEKNKQAIEEHKKKMGVQGEVLEALRKREAEAKQKAAEKEEALNKLKIQQETTLSSLTEAKEKAKRLGRQVNQKDRQISVMKKELKEVQKEAKNLEAEKLRLEEEAEEREQEKRKLEKETREKQSQLEQVFGDAPITESVMFTVQKQRSNVVDLGDTSNLDFLFTSISLTSGHEIRLYSQFTYYLISDQNTFIFKGDEYKPVFLNKYFSKGVNKAMVLEGNAFRYPQKISFRPDIQYDVKSTHSDMVKTVHGTDVVSLIDESGLDFRGPYLMTPHKSSKEKR